MRNVNEFPQIIFPNRGTVVLSGASNCKLIGLARKCSKASPGGKGLHAAIIETVNYNLYRFPVSANLRESSWNAENYPLRMLTFCPYCAIMYWLKYANNNHTYKRGFIL